MLLSGDEIRNQRKLGNIEIQDFDEKRLGPNSYNLRLAPDILVYTEVILDPMRENRTRRLIIPKEGMVLKPGRLYLAKTMEYTRTRNLVPMLEGRSSVGRLGIFPHVAAGFGDAGFRGNWTLELTCVQPVRVYPGMEICQIYYHTIKGKTNKEYNGKYQGSTDVAASRMFQEMNQGNRK